MAQFPQSKNLSRRTAMAGMIGTAALATSAPAFVNIQKKQPNFLFIMADDMGFADLSCYGRTEYETPVLDELANQGMRLTHAYANSAVCTATRVALITGRYQYRLPIGLQEPLGASTEVGLPPAHPTIASLLRQQGYTTSLIGKWHLGALPKFGPLKSGYDEFWGIRGGGVDYFSHAAFGAKDLWDGETKIEEQGYLTELLTDKAMATLDRRKSDGKPWLMSLHYTAPHWPWEGPEDKAESDRLGASENIASHLHYDGGNMDTYAAMVTELDRQIGRLLDKLTTLDMEQETVVIFTSDNGGERFSKTWPFTGKKTELLEGGLRIPAIIRWPHLTKPGTTSDVPIMSMDWLPTFVAAAGGSPHPRFPTDGMDIRPVLQGASLPDRMLYWRFGNKGQEAVRSGNWKYLKIGSNSFLFDVVSDPLERANWKKRKPEKFEQLQQVFKQWDADMLHDPNAPSYGFTPEQLADHFGMDS